MGGVNIEPNPLAIATSSNLLVVNCVPAYLMAAAQVTYVVIFNLTPTLVITVKNYSVTMLSSTHKPANHPSFAHFLVETMRSSVHFN